MTTRTAKKSNLGNHEQKWHDPVQVMEQWCIYRIPSRLRNVNEAAYTPQVISIGPFHHGSAKLRDMERHKKQYYKNFCKRSQKTKPELKTFIRERREGILLCYAGAIEGDIDFAKVILVDACFIIELFLMNCEEYPENYYILRSPLLKKAVEQDLVLLENQIPYGLLQELYDFAMPASSCYLPRKEIQAQAQEQGHRQSSTTNHVKQNCVPCLPFSMPSSRHPLSNDHVEVHVHHDFLELTIEFLQEYTKRQSMSKGVKPKHFTDLVRHFLCPKEQLIWTEKDDSNILPKSIYDVRKLRDAGVHFRPNEGSDRFIIKKDEDRKCSFRLPCFRTMDLKLTRFWARYEVECVIRNVMALEQLMYPKESYVCSYFLMLDQLVDTVEDVNLLVDNGVIVNLLGSSKAVVRLINSLSEQIMDSKSCYADICEQLNHHHEVNVCNRSLAILKQVYFKDLWTGSSTILGIFVLVFSVIGTIKSLMS